MFQAQEAIKARLPLWLLSRLREVKNYFFTRQKFGDNSFLIDAIASLRPLFWPKKIILFFPERPCTPSVAFRVCAMLGYAISVNPNRRFDVLFKLKDTTFFDQTELQKIPSSSRHKIINANSVDISKRSVGKAFEDVFGYALEVDPTQYHGRIVEKSNKNATHDGRIFEGPISQKHVQSECVYQKAIDNTSDKDGLILDYRVPIHGDQIPLVYLKYRPTKTRFSNKNAFVELEDPRAAFSSAELDKFLLFARKMGMDYGEIDVLRDKDKRIYIVDANNTPLGPPNGLPKSESKIALELLAKSFSYFLEKWISLDALQ